MAREAAADSEQRRATTALALLDALASPPWEEVCRADGDSDAQAETLPADSLPAVRAALLTHEGLRLPWGERDLEVWSRALGSVARNSLWVRIPNPLVFYLSEFEGALPGAALPSDVCSTVERLKASQACAVVLPALCATIERIKAKTMAGQRSGAKKRG